MKKIFCILVLGLLVAHNCAKDDKDKPDDKAKDAEDKGKDAVKAAEDTAKGAKDTAKAAAKDVKDATKAAAKDADDAEDAPEETEKIPKKALNHKRKPSADDDDEDCEPTPHHRRKPHRPHIFDVPLAMGESMVEGAFGMVTEFGQYLPF